LTEEVIWNKVTGMAELRVDEWQRQKGEKRVVYRYIQPHLRHQAHKQLLMARRK